MASSSDCSFLGGVTTKADAESTSATRREKESAREVQKTKKEFKLEQNEKGFVLKRGLWKRERGFLLSLRRKRMGSFGGLGYWGRSLRNGEIRTGVLERCGVSSVEMREDAVAAIAEQGRLRGGEQLGRLVVASW